MSESHESHGAPFNAAVGRKIDLDLPDGAPLREDVNVGAAADDNENERMSRTDRSYTSVPASDSGSLASGEETASNAPGSEKCGLQSQEPPKKLVVLRPWLFELLALLIGFLAFSGITTILSVYNDKPQLEFARYVNINTIIAILSTTLRAAMAFIATEVIGQSKWDWLETPRPVRHVERLDNAGRGAWGSMKFLIFVFKPNFAVMGALLILASYVLDPFAQQLAKTYACNITSDEEASIFVARRARYYYSPERPLMWLAATTGLNGLNLNYGMGETSKSRLFQCPSGNCTFPSKSGITHTSVGICSTCTDVTSDLMERDLGNQRMAYHFLWQPNLNLTWPPEPQTPYFRVRTVRNYLRSFWIMTTSVITFSAAACRNNSEASRTNNETRCHQMGYNMDFSEWKKGTNVGIVAVNCTLEPCLRHYGGGVSLGTLKEKLVSQEPINWVTVKENLGGPRDQPWFIKFEPCEVNGRWYNSSNITKTSTDDTWISWRDSEDNMHQAPEQCVMALSEVISSDIGLFQYDVMQGNVQFGPLDDDLRHVAWLSTLARNGKATFGSISDSFSGMATGFTDFIRGDWEEVENERFNVVGVASKSAVCIRADWPWLVYPGVLLVSTTILLIVACVHSMREGGRRPVWKSTILPFLFYNLKINRDEDQDQPDENGMDVPLLQLKELETLADKTVAMFSADAAAPGFIVEGDGNSSGGASTGQQVGLLRRVFKPRSK